MESAKPTIKNILEQVIDQMVRGGILWPEALEQFEKLFILRVLREHDGNLSRSAEAMGIHRNSMSAKLKKYGINRRDAQRPDIRPKNLS